MVLNALPALSAFTASPPVLSDMTNTSGVVKSGLRYVPPETFSGRCPFPTTIPLVTVSAATIALMTGWSGLW
jgi:hypothetical protein